MRTGFAILGLMILLLLAGAPAEARPRAPAAAAADPAVSRVVKASHRAEMRHRRNHARYWKKHDRARHAGWLPRLKDHPHLPGKWHHKHCHDWHRSHYYFYGYEQWVKWNPDKSRAYFRRHYHH